MSRPLLPAVVVATLAFVSHVVPRFVDDPELLDGDSNLTWALASGAAPGCLCGPGVIPRADLRRQSTTAGMDACCNRRGETR